MISSERDVYISGHVTQGVKDAIRQAAKDAGQSMSEWQYLTLRDVLIQKGYTVDEGTKVPPSEPLPFEEGHETVDSNAQRS